MLQLMTRKCWARLPEMASSSCSDNPAVKHACLLSVCPHLIPFHHTRIVLAIQRTSAIRNSTSFFFVDYSLILVCERFQFLSRERAL